MIYGSNIGYRQAKDNQAEVTWVDHLVVSNPYGVIEVLSRNGYSGYLAPKDDEEMLDAAYDFIERRGEKAVIELLKAHPLYDVISDISREERKISLNFLNADGSESSVISTIRTMDHKKVITTILIILGAYFVANKVWGLISK